MAVTRSLNLSFLILGLVFFLVGCSFPPPDLNNLSDDQLQRVTDRNLCEAYFHGQGKNVREEIKRRALVPRMDWSFVEKNKVRDGMKECSVRASMGDPSVTRAKTDADPEQVFVYRRDDRRIEVELHHGRVRVVRRIEQ